MDARPNAPASVMRRARRRETANTVDKAQPASKRPVKEQPDLGPQAGLIVGAPGEVEVGGVREVEGGAQARLGRTEGASRAQRAHVDEGGQLADPVFDRAQQGEVSPP